MCALFSFRNKKDCLKQESKFENHCASKNENKLKSADSESATGMDFIKLWENCEEQQECLGDYLRKLDELILSALEVVIEYGQASVSIVERRLRIGYSRAARLVDIMEEYHFVGPFEGMRPRSVNITAAQLEKVLKTFKYERKYCSEAKTLSKHTTETTSTRVPELDLENGLAFLYAKFGYHTIDGMDGQTFEKFCANLLELTGFQNVKVTASTGDQGVDILALRGGVRYAIQCKSYTSPLGNTPIQEVYAGKAFYDCHVGVVMTNSTFTTGAVELAKKTGVLLWDGKYIKAILGFVASELDKQNAGQ